MLVEGLPIGISKKDFINFIKGKYNSRYNDYSFSKFNHMKVEFDIDIIVISLYNFDKNYNFMIKLEDYTIYLRDCKIRSIW